MKQQLRAFRENYLAAALVMLLLVVCSGASAQRLLDVNNYGFRWQRGEFREGLRLPVRDTLAAPDSIGQVVYRQADSSLYLSISVSGPKKWARSGADFSNFFSKMEANSRFLQNRTPYSTVQDTGYIECQNNICDTFVWAKTPPSVLDALTINAPLSRSGNTLGLDTANSGTTSVVNRGRLIQLINSAVSGGISSITLLTSGSIHNTPVNFTNNNGAWSGALNLATQSANRVFAGPTTGVATQPAFRSLVAADIPDLDAGKITTGVFPAARLGTGTANNTTVLYGDGVYRAVSGGGATITSPGAGRFITSDGTASGLVGQANATWDGQTMQLTNTTNVSAFRLNNTGITSGVLMDLEMPATSNINDGKALSFKTNGESFARGMVYSNGMIGWGPGTSTRDVYLHRTAANTLRISGNGNTTAANLEVQGTITASGGNSTNWNTAFGWGNHAGLYRPISYVPTWAEVTGKPSFATVATSGSYTDLSNQPAIPTIATPGAGRLITSTGTATGLAGQSNLFYDATNVRLGVGTASPGTALDVVGNITSSNAVSSSSENGYIEIKAGTTAGAGGTITAGTQNYAALGTLKTLASTYTFNGNVSDQPFLNINSSGNVGIGPTSPPTGNRLHVQGYIASNWLARFENNGTSGHNVYLGYNDGTATTTGMYITGGRTTAGGTHLNVGDAFYVMGSGEVRVNGLTAGQVVVAGANGALTNGGSFLSTETPLITTTGQTVSIPTNSYRHFIKFLGPTGSNITLPLANVAGQELYITNGSANSLAIVSGTGRDAINYSGAIMTSIPAQTSYIFRSNGTNWIRYN